MDNMEEDEDEMSLLNYQSPKGQLIKLLEKKMKKPEIDDSLGKVLDQFSQLTKEQNVFLENGVFHMNFAEDALLLQACGQFYAKRVDKLWCDLLQLHTRLVKHDEHAAKHCTNRTERAARKAEMSKLEERLNRGKRKKICLTEPDNDNVPVEGEYFVTATVEESAEIFDDPSFRLFGEESIPQPASVPFEFVAKQFSQWQALSREVKRQAERNFNSLFVSHYHSLRYRFKHYGTPTGRDMIYDMNDPEEFNAREGRLISYHYIRHLFDDNDRCLIPDENYTIAKLRLSYILRRKFLVANKINPTEPPSNYRDSWEKYLTEFLERENRKIQNMPQTNSDQMITFYKALARKEQLAYEKVKKLKEMGVTDLPTVCFETVIVEPAKDGYEGIFDPYIPDELYTPKPVNIADFYGGSACYPDTDSDVEFVSMMNKMMRAGHQEDTQDNSEVDHEAEISLFLENMPDNPDHSTAEVKSRADSGYFEGGFADENESVTGTETPFELEMDSFANKESETDHQQNATDLEAVETSELSVEDADSHGDDVIDIYQCVESGIAMTTRPDLVQFTSSSEMNEQLKKLSENVSQDHRESIYRALENSYYEEIDGIISIVYNKTKSLEETVVRGNVVGKKICSSNSLIEGNQKTNKRKGQLECDRPVKQRRLSGKQVEKLKRGVITPTREAKWEYFYSLNYQPESGEGEIPRLDWEAHFDDNDDDLFSDSDEECTAVDLDGQEEADDCEEECHPESSIPATQDSGIETLAGDTSQEDGAAADSYHNAEVTDTLSLAATTTTEPPTSNSLVAELESLQNGVREPEPLLTESIEDMTPNERERYESKKQVAEWREFITPKLKQLNDHDFDIYEYGSRMMNSMTVNEPKLFSDFVSGKSSTEVVRYFVASLQLANTSNVEISGVKPGQLSNETFELKLLSKDRYHEHLQEYQAPSEEGLKEKLIKIKEIRQQNKALMKKGQGLKRAGKAKTPEPPKKIKALKVSQPRHRLQSRNFDSQEPCSSQQADVLDEHNSISPRLNDLMQNRVSIDSGFIPTCDDEFLEQFDQLQQITEGNLQSTPIVPKRSWKFRNNESDM